jgi:hypothetical protein
MFDEVAADVPASPVAAFLARVRGFGSAAVAMVFFLAF